jgi:Protein of unknown function (DUF 659)
MPNSFSDDISRIIEKLSSSHVVGAVTDNTSTNKVAWSLLKQRFPGRFFQGCASHCLHLLVKDIFCTTKTKRGQNVATYPDDYPFEYLLEFVAECKELVSFFHNHHFHQALLTKSLEEKSCECCSHRHQFDGFNSSMPLFDSQS